jgi:hypothetical protein
MQPLAARSGPKEPMEELLRSSNLVFVSYVQALLAAEGIEAIVLDQHMGAAHTNIDAFPRRVTVDDENLKRARQILIDAGHAAELTPLRR